MRIDMRRKGRMIRRGHLQAMALTKKRQTRAGRKVGGISRGKAKPEQPARVIIQSRGSVIVTAMVTIQDRRAAMITTVKVTT